MRRLRVVAATLLDPARPVALSHQVQANGRKFGWLKSCSIEDIADTKKNPERESISYPHNPCRAANLSVEDPGHEKSTKC